MAVCAGEVGAARRTSSHRSGVDASSETSTFNANTLNSSVH